MLVLIIIAAGVGFFVYDPTAIGPGIVATTMPLVAITYDRASADTIIVATPTPGAVVGKTFAIKGQARGIWYFEASFPIEVRDAAGTVLTTVVAQAEGEWMTTAFVPFTATATVPASYIGPATIVLKKDNPSGLSEHDASASYPITVE